MSNYSRGIKVHLAEIGKARSPAGQISVPNEGASVRVSFDAMPFHQDDGALRPLAEMMPSIGRHGHDSPFERQIQHGCSVQNHAARANDPRFRRTNRVKLPSAVQRAN